jgi:hypothetical protein
MPRRFVLTLAFVFVSYGIGESPEAQAQARRRSAGPTVRTASPGSGPAAKWLGQTGQDHAGKATTLGANSIQDIQVRVTGIPVASITSIVLKGYGSGEWQWAPDGKPPGGWAIHMIPDPRTNAADLFFECGEPETGRQFELKWTVPGQPEGSLYFQGGAFDPTKPVASARIAAKWIGQSAGQPVDLTNPTASVGPDGFEDFVVQLSSLSDRDDLASVDIESADGKFRWAFGVNPKGAWNAELVREPAKSTTARLVLAVPPAKIGTIEGKSLTIRARYASDAVTEAEVTAGRAEADKPMPQRTLPKVVESRITPRWLGPVARSKAGAGAVRIELSGLSSEGRLLSAVLTDVSGATFATANAKVDGPSQPLVVERNGTDKAQLDFVPNRDLDGRTLSLRLIYADGASAFLNVDGGVTELNRRIPPIASTKTQVFPGQDLQAAVNRGGTVVLGDGEHRLNRTLMIDRPTRLEAAPNARPVLVFSGGSGGPWTAAIKIRTGGVTLSGFAIRFAGSIAWKDDVAYGPAVIATTDPDDRGFDHDAMHWGVNLEKLDVIGPPPSGSSGATPPEAVKTAKILNGALGRIEGCILRGGTVHLAGGPWTIAGNRHDGPLPGSFSYDAFAVTRPLDVRVDSNRIEPVRGSGKLWRFINLTHYGTDVRVEGNIVKNVGPRTDDSIGDMNANEILLTESYRVKSEGIPAAVSSDGFLMVLADMPGGAPAPGDALTLLTGPEAGSFRTIVQNLGDGVVRVDRPLPTSARSGTSLAVSVATGFRETAFVGNTIDATGSDTSFNLCLAGNHFGTVIKDNTILGGGESLRVTSFATEAPNVWGWTHVPMAEIVIEGNTVKGAAKPARVAVDQGPTIKTSSGRTYYSAVISGNVFGPSREGPALQVGDPGTLDSTGTVLTLSGNESDKAEGEILVLSGRINGKDLNDARLPVTTRAKSR